MRAYGSLRESRARPRRSRARRTLLKAGAGDRQSLGEHAHGGRAGRAERSQRAATLSRQRGERRRARQHRARVSRSRRPERRSGHRVGHATAKRSKGYSASPEDRQRVRVAAVHKLAVVKPTTSAPSSSARSRTSAGASSCSFSIFSPVIARNALAPRASTAPATGASCEVTVTRHLPRRRHQAISEVARKASPVTGTVVGEVRQRDDGADRDDERRDEEHHELGGGPALLLLVQLVRGSLVAHGELLLNETGFEKRRRIAWPRRAIETIRQSQQIRPRSSNGQFPEMLSAFTRRREALLG